MSRTTSDTSGLDALIAAVEASDRNDHGFPAGLAGEPPPKPARPCVLEYVKGSGESPRPIPWEPDDALVAAIKAARPPDEFRGQILGEFPPEADRRPDRQAGGDRPTADGPVHVYCSCRAGGVRVVADLVSDAAAALTDEP